MHTTVLGKIIWFLLWGWALFLLYTLAATDLFSVFIPLFCLARHSAWPFGFGVVTRGQMNTYREIDGSPLDISETQNACYQVTG
jgi:uncharacterized membrane protein YccF (DUF307 family)